MSEPTVTVPVYAQGVKVESSYDIHRMQDVVDVSLHLRRTVTVSDEMAANHPTSAKNEAVAEAVRQMQNEAVRELGLNHWRTEVERDAREVERRERRELLRALAQAVRSAPTTDAAALLVLDELEVMDRD